MHYKSIPAVVVGSAVVTASVVDAAVVAPSVAPCYNNICFNVSVIIKKMIMIIITII